MFLGKFPVLAMRLLSRAILVALLVSAGLSLHAQSNQSADATSLPAATLFQPADLARELAAAPDSRPVILYVGFRTLFAGGHISGATFHGTASTQQGLSDIKKWAEPLPRTTNLVIYCGCCPFQRCPNIRPAFALFRNMGFMHVRVLELPTNFATDWVDKQFPTEKGTN